MTMIAIVGLPFLKTGEYPPCTTHPRLFDDPTNESDIILCRRACSSCRVLLSCQAYGLEHPEETGFLGGRTESERNGSGLPQRLKGAARASRDIRDLKEGTITLAEIAHRDRVKLGNVTDRLRKYGWSSM